MKQPLPNSHGKYPLPILHTRSDPWSTREAQHKHAVFTGWFCKLPSKGGDVVVYPGILGAATVKAGSQTQRSQYLHARRHTPPLFLLLYLLILSAFIFYDPQGDIFYETCGYGLYCSFPTCRQ